MIDLCLEVDLWWLERVFRRENNLDSKCTLVEWRSVGDEKALPLENVCIIHDYVAERFQTSLSYVLKLAKKECSLINVSFCIQKVLYETEALENSDAPLLWENTDYGDTEKKPELGLFQNQ